MKVSMIETALDDLRQSAGLPVPVRSWHVETGADATGDPAIWVWVTLDDHVELGTRDQIREQVRHTIQRMDEDAPWVYVRFRTASEEVTL